MIKPALPATIQKTIDEIATRGRLAWEAGDHELAEREFLSAWDAIPEPKEQHDFYPQILARRILTLYRDTGQFELASKWFTVLRRVYNSNSNPSVEFLIATVLLESGDTKGAFAAFDALHRQYGRRPFEGENPKYLDFYVRSKPSRGKTN